MSDVKWMIRGPNYGNCNCDWGCPCQFNKLPTHGNCRSVDGMRIEEGFYGETRLDGLHWVNTFGWPGAVHEGNGECQSFVDERADEAQRAAILEIISGRASKEGNDVFNIFASTYTTVHDPIFARIEFECDVEKREARIFIDGVLESTGTPMHDPFTGDAQRATLLLPGGMEFTKVECGSGTTRATGAVKLDHADSWGQFSIYHFTQDGIVG